MRILKGHRGKLRAVVYSPDGSKLATAGDDGMTKMWDAVTGRELGTIHQPTPNGSVHAAAFSPDGKLLATGSTAVSKAVRVWDVDTLAEVPLPDGIGKCNGARLAFTPDGSQLLFTRPWVREPGSTLLAWDRRTGALCTPFGTQRANASALAVSASANVLAVTLSPWHKGYVGLWSLSSKASEGMLDHSKETFPGLHCLAISPDGRTLAVAGGPRVFVWDLPGRRLRGRLEGHPNKVNCVAFSPDSRLIATASHDRTVRFWDVESLKQRAVFDWETGKVLCVAFHPDGMTAVAAGERRRVVIWDVE